MKKIHQRNKIFRINTPLSFGLFCAVIIMVIAIGLYALGSGVIAPGIKAIELAKATPTPEPTAVPSPTPTIEPEIPDGNIATAIDPVTGEIITAEEPTPTPEPTPEPVPKNLEGKTIVIDAGKSSEGAHKGISSGTPEHKINLAFAEALKEELEARGATVVMTRTDEKPVSAEDRMKIIDESHGDLLISLYCNDHQDNKKTRGAEMFVGKKDPVKAESQKLATTVFSAYRSATDMPARKKDIRFDGDKSVLNKSQMPSMGLVLGQLSNKTDDANLNDTAFIGKAVKGITKGICKYLGAD